MIFQSRNERFHNLVWRPSSDHLQTTFGARRKETKTMPLTSDETSQIVKDFGRTEGDTGCPEVQVALLTARIKQVATHLRDNKQDMHNRRGLVMMVAKRNRLLRYLARTNRDSYLDTIKRLGLRK